MIQATGILALSGGICVINPLINVRTEDSTKYQPKLGIAEIGNFIPFSKITKAAIPAIEEQRDEEGNITQEFIAEIPAETTEGIKFEKIHNIGIYPFSGKNPCFDNIQEAVLEGLRNDFPTVTFEIV